MKKFIKKTILLITILLLVGTYVGCKEENPTETDPPKEYRDNGNLVVHFIDVGQADCIFIQLPNNETLMIDAGFYSGLETVTWSKIKSTLYKLNIKTIDHLLVTHNHQDHYGLIPNIFNEYEVKNFYGSGSVRNNGEYRDMIKAIKDEGIEYLVVESKDILIQEGDLLFQVITTLKVENDNSNPNLASIIAKLTYKNNSFMFTGDAGYLNGDGESRALSSGLDLKSDVLKVGHHGSAYSSGVNFLNRIQPKYAVLTTIENSKHNLPTESALSRLERIGAIIYQTKDHGTIVMNSDGTNITVSTEKGN